MPRGEELRDKPEWLLLLLLQPILRRHVCTCVPACGLLRRLHSQDKVPAPPQQLNDKRTARCRRGCSGNGRRREPRALSRCRAGVLLGDAYWLCRRQHLRPRRRHHPRVCHVPAVGSALSRRNRAQPQRRGALAQGLGSDFPSSGGMGISGGVATLQRGI
jgi:hypothetical protein